MTDKERIANAREYLAAQRARTHAEHQLEESERQSYPTDDSEARALAFPLADIRDAQQRMNDCLAKV